MTEKPVTRRRGRAKPIPFLHIPEDEQREYNEVSLNGAPTEEEATLGALAGYYDTGGYVFSRYPSKLTHPNWREFKDPDKYWFRTYNRYLANQAMIITHGTETLLSTGFLEFLDPGWQDALRYLAAFRFHEAGALRLWQVTQYMAASETISYCAVEECGSRLLAVHSINRYALDLTAAVDGWDDENAKDLWVDDPVYTGVREYVEHELTIRDWGEAVLADAVVAVTLYYEPILRFFAVNGAAHGDVSTPTIVSSFTDMAERRLRWGKALIAFALSQEPNRPVLEEWLARWEPRAEAALESLAPLYEGLPRPVLKYSAEADRARASYQSTLEELGLSGGKS
ncbi:MAG: hypothetical protein ACRDV9_03515 [Acidimicrobiia bacterium]